MLTLGLSTRTEELVEAAIAGDRDAFEGLLEAAAPAAYRAALAVLGSPEDARDALQEAALRAWRHLPELRNAGAWHAWFGRIAVRAAQDQARQRRRAQERTALDLDEQIPDPAPGVVERLAMLNAVGRLSAADREVLALRFGADLEVPDLAAALGIPLGTAKARLHRALGRLRKQWETTGDE